MVSNDNQGINDKIREVCVAVIAVVPEDFDDLIFWASVRQGQYGAVVESSIGARIASKWFQIATWNILTIHEKVEDLHRLMSSEKGEVFTWIEGRIGSDGGFKIEFNYDKIDGLFNANRVNKPIYEGEINMD